MFNDATGSHSMFAPRSTSSISDLRIPGIPSDALDEEKEKSLKFNMLRAVWQSDADVIVCPTCGGRFGLTKRRHHCRSCGGIYCDSCSTKRTVVPHFKIEQPVRVCDICHEKIQIALLEEDGLDYQSSTPANATILLNLTRKSDKLDKLLGMHLPSS
jgi:hypothetical protein